MQVGDKIVYCGYESALKGKIGKIIDIHASYKVGVKFENFNGHDLDGRVAKGGWWVNENEIRKANTKEVEKEFVIPLDRITISPTYTPFNEWRL